MATIEFQRERLRAIVDAPPVVVTTASVALGPQPSTAFFCSVCGEFTHTLMPPVFAGQVAEAYRPHVVESIGQDLTDDVGAEVAAPPERVPFLGSALNMLNSC